jgi:hypothetical protein
MTDSSLLADVEEYLAYRRGLGYGLATAACHLRSFAQHAEQNGHRGPITVDLAVRWALCSPASCINHLPLSVFAL